MRINKTNGMMAFWTDISEKYILRFQEWHNCEHMIERTSIPGFMVGREVSADRRRADVLYQLRDNRL